MRAAGSTSINGTCLTVFGSTLKGSTCIESLDCWLLLLLLYRSAEPSLFKPGGSGGGGGGGGGGTKPLTIRWTGTITSIVPVEGGYSVTLAPATMQLAPTRY